jgi:hypothetical protein
VAPSALISSSVCWRFASPEKISARSSWKIDSCLFAACAGAAANAPTAKTAVSSGRSSLRGIPN